MSPAEASQHPRPFNREFYESARAAAAQAAVEEDYVIEEPTGYAIDVKAGQVFRIELLEGPQVVNLFLLNANDPDERLWVHETLLVDGLWATRFNRLWGTMARFRPLATILEDTVAMRAIPGQVGAKHHCVHGGAGVPRLWSAAGGSKDVPTTWEQFTGALKARGLDGSLLKGNLCLFQKTQLDAYSQRLTILPSDATAGDRVDLFAEIDLTVLVALSPYVDGVHDPRSVGIGDIRPVVIRRSDFVATPLEWPYPDMGYPDLSLYLGPDGTRRDVVGPTPGRESPA